MSLREVERIFEEYDIANNEENIEIVLEVLDKFGTARDVFIEGLKPEYKFLKKTSKLLAMLDIQVNYGEDAEEIKSLMYDIYKVVADDSESKGEDFKKLLKTINVRKTFNPTQMQLWVMNDVGGRILIGNITKQEPNNLLKRIVNSIERYKRLPDESEKLVIENKAFANLQIKKY